MAKTTEPNLVDLFAKADASQLEAIDQMIAECKCQQAAIQKQVDGLAAIRKALEIKLNGKPERKQTQRKPAAKPKETPDEKPPISAAYLGLKPVRQPGEQGGQLMEQTYAYLDRVNKPMSCAAIASALGVDGRTLIQKLKQSAWIAETPQGYIIARK